MTDTDKAMVEHRLSRIRAVLVALPCVAMKGDNFGGVGNTCELLGLMAEEEMVKVMAVLGTDVLNRDC